MAGRIVPGAAYALESSRLLLRRNHGVIYKFGQVDHDYNPHGRARVIQVTEDMEEVPL